MTNEPNQESARKYLERRTAIFDVVNYVLEQADVLTDDRRIADDDREELRIGALMLSDGVQQFFQCSEAALIASGALSPVFLHLTDCLYAVLGGSASTFRHIEISNSKIKEIFRNSGKPGSIARTAKKELEAEKVRHIIERAEKNSSGKLTHPGAVRGHILRFLNREKLDYKTLASWVEYIEGTRKTAGLPEKG